ncbi:Hypothetical protein PBC10988_19640 [Planctomycetales bacterium 10988]|nr:Hypothetical protein PBC10988_19640 [Planctomycetales bacterium 10988]
MEQQLERASLLIQQERFDLAEQELQQLLQVNPQLADAHYLMALLFLVRKDLKAAQTSAQKAVHFGPTQPHTHAMMSQVWLASNRLPEAQTSIEEAIRLDPANAEHLAQEAAIYLRQERWQEALNAANAGLAFDPEDEECINYRAIALVRLGKADEAEIALDASMQKDPENALTHANQGWVALEQGDQQRALKHFQEALRIDPQNEWSRTGLLHAIKSQNFFYRKVLDYFLWMSKLGAATRWGVIIGGYLLIAHLLPSLYNGQLAMTIFIVTVTVLYVAFALSTWLTVPIADLFLFLHPLGKYALSTEEKRTALSVAGWLGLGILFGILGWLVLPLFYFAAISSVLLALLMSLYYDCDQGWPRKTMFAMMSGIFLIGIAPSFLYAPVQLIQTENVFLNTLAVIGFLIHFFFGRVFLFVVIGAEFFGNYLAQAQPKH